MSRIRTFRDGDGGQAIVIVAAIIAVLLLGVGLAIDAGGILSSRRTQQVGADAAAWGGATKIAGSATAAQVIAAVCADAQENGFTDPTCVGGATSYNGASAPRPCSANTATTVKVYFPPCSGSHLGDTKYVEVTIGQDVSSIFLRGSGSGGKTHVEGRGVAGVSTQAGGPALLALHTGSYSGAIKISGTTAVTVVGGSVVADSTNSKAVSIKLANQLTDATGMCLVGGVDNPSFFVGPLTTSSASCNTADPLSASLNSSTEPTGTLVPGSLVGSTYQPGYYASGISFNSGTRHMAAGTYSLKGGLTVSGGATLIIDAPTVAGTYTTIILQGGGMTVSGTGTTVTGTEVMFFNANDPTTGTTGCQNIDVGATINVSAPTSGPYNDIAVWVDSACTSSKQVKFTGQGSSTLYGIIYAPNNYINIGSGAGVNFSLGRTSLIGDHIEIANDSPITVDMTGSRLAVTGVPALVE